LTSGTSPATPAAQDDCNGDCTEHQRHTAEHREAHGRAQADGSEEPQYRRGATGCAGDRTDPDDGGVLP
jgi:hypothetical protein